MSKPRKPISKVVGESEGRAFWEKNDSTAFIDWTKAQRAVFPNLKPEIGASVLRCYGDERR